MKYSIKEFRGGREREREKGRIGAEQLKTPSRNLGNVPKREATREMSGPFSVPALPPHTPHPTPTSRRYLHNGISTAYLERMRLRVEHPLLLRALDEPDLPALLENQVEVLEHLGEPEALLVIHLGPAVRAADV